MRSGFTIGEKPCFGVGAKPLCSGLFFFVLFVSFVVKIGLRMAALWLGAFGAS
jgi:hypothetical protein